MAEPAATQGQATSDPKGTTAAAPTGAQGQSAASTQTTGNGSGGGDVESFFDPKSIAGKPELESAYKQMQGKFTKELTRFKEGKKKAEAYDAFVSNPGESLQKLANQLGYNLVQRDPNAKDDPANQAPKTWQDVYSRAKQEVLKELQPVLGEVRQLKQQNVEQYLDNHHADWRTFEGEMLETLQAHPSLALDPDKLYRLSVPEEVLEARAHKAALVKLKGSSDAGQVSGATATRQIATDEVPKKGSSFNDFVNYAKAKLKSQGMNGLGG